MGFLSTPSARRATHSVLRDPEHGAISIHALREEGDHRLRLQRLRLTISIHALREEGDPLPLRVFDYKEHFYPRPPRGGRPNNFATQAYPLNFYPRPPRGGRPDRCNAGMHACEFLSTPSARRATSGLRPGAQDHPISIHALREEGDPVFWYRPRSVLEFLSTPSARRATSPLCAISTSKRFLSTPSARRATAPIRQSASLATNFYPRPPRGGRPTAMSAQTDTILFLSTPSARRATRLQRRDAAGRRISIHALREEGDGGERRTGNRGRISIHALREEGDRDHLMRFHLVSEISIHALREEGDGPRSPPARCTPISIHALREEGDRQREFMRWPAYEFLSTPSARRATVAIGHTVVKAIISIHALREEGDSFL